MAIAHDKEDFEKYVMNMFNEDFINPKLQKQIASYMKQYNYTYSGMLKALVYFYEVKGNSIEKAHHSLGILPYVYDDAYRYYYSLWMADQRNVGKDILQYVPKQKIVSIPVPIRKPYKRKLFSFLDIEEEGEDK